MADITIPKAVFAAIDAQVEADMNAHPGATLKSATEPQVYHQEGFADRYVIFEDIESKGHTLKKFVELSETGARLMSIAAPSLSAKDFLRVVHVTCGDKNFEVQTLSSVPNSRLSHDGKACTVATAPASGFEESSVTLSGKF